MKWNQVEHVEKRLYLENEQWRLIRGHYPTSCSNKARIHAQRTCEGPKEELTVYRGLAAERVCSLAHTCAFTEDTWVYLPFETLDACSKQLDVIR